MYHVVPAGVFQSAALAPAHQANDFSFWRNIQREFSRSSSATPRTTATASTRSTTSPRSRRTPRSSGLGWLVTSGSRRSRSCSEPLTLWVELLAVAVMEGPVFDTLYGVAVNEEGAAVSTDADKPTVEIPFTSAAREPLEDEPLSPIARACIELAWRRRRELVGSLGRA